MTPLSLGEQHEDRARRGAGGTAVGTSWSSGHFLLRVPDLRGAALGCGSQRSKGCQEAPLIGTEPLCLLLPHTEQVSVISCYWVLIWLTAISAKKDMKKLCRLCCHCNLSNRTMWVLWGAQCLAYLAVSIAIPTVTYLCPSQEQEHCQVVLTSTFAVTLLIFAAPMVITRTIDIVKAKCGSQQQQPKRFDIVIFIIVLFTLFLSLWNFLQHLGYVSSQVFFPFACIHSTIKPFIYFLAGRCWSPCSVGSLRLSLQRVIEETERQNCQQQGYQQGHGGPSLLIPSPALLNDPGTVTEGFLEPPDQ
ncbi:uncharacterized protein ACIQIH_008525 isoform 1-T1 [Cyanocitta cristata]